MWQVHQACQKKMLLVRGGQPQGQGHWPIPEAYWPDPTHQGVPPRDPHPTIAYKPMDTDPYIPPNFIFDKYEVHKSASDLIWLCVCRWLCDARVMRQNFGQRCVCNFRSYSRLMCLLSKWALHSVFFVHVPSLLWQIESNPIMGFLLKANAGVCWQVYIRNSKGTNHGYGDPFG